MAEKPETPSQGKPMEEEQASVEAQDATAETSKQKAAEKAAPKPKAEKKAPAKKKAEGTAAKATKTEKKAAEAVAEGDADAKGAAKEASATAGKAKKAPAKAKAADKPKASSEEKAAAKPAARKRDRREAPQAVVVRAQARYVRSSARKARLVCDQIRGKTVPEARALLAFSPRSVSEAWTKLLDSAVANAEHNHDLDGDELKILAVYADEGPTIKRFRPRAMGRATSIHKRTSHLTIQLTPKETR